MTTARSSARADAERARQHQTDHTTLTAACVELGALWPQLHHALQADTNGSDVIGSTATGPRTPRLANEDVADAAHEFALWLIVTRGECVPILHPDPIPYGSTETLAAIPTWFDQLHKRNLPTAGYLYNDALRVHRQARRALGLHTHDRPAGANCPEHPEPAPLYWLGRDGTLDHAILHSPSSRTTWRISTGAITWTRSDTIRCPQCGTTWAGRAAINILSERLTHTRILDAETITTVLAADGIHIQPATLRVWQHRGHLTRHGTDPKGRALYDLDEAEKCATVTGNGRRAMPEGPQ